MNHHLGLKHIYWDEKQLDLEIRQHVAVRVAPALHQLVMTAAAEITAEYGDRALYRDLAAEYIVKLIGDMISFDDLDQEAVLRPHHITTEIFADYLLPSKQAAELTAIKIAVRPRIDVPLEAVQ